MKKTYFAIPLVAVSLLFASCDPKQIDLGSADGPYAAEQLASGFSYVQYSDEAHTTAAPDGNYFTYTTNPSVPVQVFTRDKDENESIIGYGTTGSFKLVPKRGESSTQTIYIRTTNTDGTITETSKEVNVYVPSDLSPEMKLLVSDAGKKIWKWDDTFRADGGAWGNLGYLPGSGESFANEGNGIWWGAVIPILNTPEQLKNAKDGKPQGDASYKAYMVFNEDNTIQTYDSLGNVIRTGKFEMKDYDGKRHPSSDGSQAEWAYGTLHTDAGTIMWPFKINGGGEEPTDFEVMQLDINHLKLIYAAPGTGGWSEATWWAFKSTSDGIGALTNYSSKDWTWDTEFRGDQAVWGNLGYAPGDGDSFVNSGNGIWWGSDPAGLTTQLDHAIDGKTHGDEDPGAYMTIDWKAATITSFDKNGGKIRQGAFELQDWGNGNRTIGSVDGSQSQWALGRLYTKDPAILWPAYINSGATVPNTYEIMQLDGDHLKLIYAAPGTGSWSEATWWAFKAKK